MPRFFITPPVGDTVIITGEDARHICKVLRMREGEALTLCDGQGGDYHCAITALSPASVEVQVLERLPNQSEPTVEITLYQALPKGDKLDFIAQKATELGVRAIVPVLTTYCVSRPDKKSMEKKRVRLQRIVAEAAKQSGRGLIPSVEPLLSFAEALGRMKQAGLAILLYEQATDPLSQLVSRPVESVALFVGSEGGFSQEEAEAARQLGIPLVSLGKRILRCETAPVCALSVLLYATGQL